MNIELVGSCGIDLDTYDSDMDVLVYSKLPWEVAINIIIKWGQNIADIKTMVPLSNKWINKIKLVMVNLQEIELM